MCVLFNRELKNFYDSYYDYFPVVSTFKNGLNIIDKVRLIFKMKNHSLSLQDSTLENVAAGLHLRKWERHLQGKSFIRCLLCLIPVLGNFAIFIYDAKQKIEKFVFLRQLNKEKTFSKELEEYSFYNNYDFILELVAKKPELIKSHKTFYVDKAFIYEACLMNIKVADQLDKKKAIHQAIIEDLIRGKYIQKADSPPPVARELYFSP